MGSYTINTTFACHPSIETRLLRYIRSELIPRWFAPGSPASNPALKKVIEIGGGEPEEDQGTSMALSVDFGSKEEMDRWTVEIMNPSLKNFNMKFGDTALFFITLLQNLRIEETDC